MDITTAGVDLAKDVITVCMQDRSGRSVDRRDLRRAAFKEWLMRLPAGCMLGLMFHSAKEMALMDRRTRPSV